jgi:hypothetical protein
MYIGSLFRKKEAVFVDNPMLIYLTLKESKVLVKKPKLLSCISVKDVVKYSVGKTL